MTPAALVAVRMRAKVEWARNNKLREEGHGQGGPTGGPGQQRLRASK